MKDRLSRAVGPASLIAFVLAVPAGLWAPGLCEAVEWMGTVYVSLLKMMMIPVLFVGIVSALAGSDRRLKGLTARTVGLFVIMFGASFLLCCGLWALLRPGVDASFTEIPWDGEIKEITLSGFVTSLFPDNILSAMSGNSVLPTILFSFALGLALQKKGASRTAEVFAELSDALGAVLSGVMLLTPFGVFALMGNTVADNGSRIIGTAALYVGCAYLGCLLVAAVVMMLPLWICCGIGPGSYVRRVYRVWLMTLTTCSSAATLPVTMKVCVEEFHVPEAITRLVVPLGCTIHMCGGAVSFSLLAAFTLQMGGITLSPGMMVLAFAAALLINMGAPGIPGGGVVIGATYLSILGLPLGFVGFYAGIYRLLDMAYTTMNVCGDITANALIARYAERSGPTEET